jgi:hypothetical protein
MSSPRRSLSRRELGLVAAALLVPLPVLAATGLSAPLPNAIERALGGLVVMDAHDEQTDSPATVAASGAGTGVKRSANGSLALTLGSGRSGRRALSPSTLSSLVTSSTNRNETGGDADTQTKHESSPDQNGGGTGEPEQPAGPGEPGPADDSAADNKAAGRTAPSAQIGVGGQGTTAGVSVGPSGVRVDAGADSGGAGLDEKADAGATVTLSDGSSTGVGVTVPGSGVPVP